MAVPDRTHPGANTRPAREQLLERIASGRLELPILPEAAASVLVACRNPVSGPRDVAEAMERDPSLTAHLLRMANSAAYAGSEEVLSLPQAIARLGLARVAEITMAGALRGVFFRASNYLNLVHEIWDHSALAGAWAREIARRRGRGEEGALLGGLLHDVGRVVVLHALLDVERTTGGSFGDPSIRAAMDEFHPRVGAALIQRWGLPPAIVSSAAWHHDWERAGVHPDDVCTTALANALAHWAGGGTPAVAEIAASGLPGRLGLGGADIEALAEARERVLEIAGAFV
jgi:HD-like signal output (HDOD) protein